jgi:thiamine-phosphate pyrophosphorylase
MAPTFVKYIDPLQFLTMSPATGPADDAPGVHLQQIEGACRAGITWVQLRMKNATDETFLETAMAAKKICDGHGCRLVLNDRVAIAAEVRAYGVHVGKEDMPVAEARQWLGEEAVIGATANTAADVLEQFRRGADYVGLGPYRFTLTKKELSPVLGPEGIRDILHTLREASVPIPVIAVGGIGPGDTRVLQEAGVYGIAFAGMFVRAADQRATVDALRREWNFFKIKK